MFVLLLLGLFLSPRQVTNKSDSRAAQSIVNDPFEAVPLEARNEVKASVDLIIKLHKERQWDRVYELLADKTVPHSEFVQENYHPWTLIEFLPIRAQQRLDKNEDWVVNGCALVDTNGKKEKWESFILINLKGSNKQIRLLIALRKSGVPMTCLQPTPNTTYIDWGGRPTE